MWKFLICALALAATCGSATAGKSGSVTACSHYGFTCVTAKIRVTKLGPQYLSPGGNWTWCDHDCEDKLRRDTVDFWEDQRERSK